MYSHCNIFVLCQVDCGKGFPNLQKKYLNGTTCMSVNKIEQKPFDTVIFQYDAFFFYSKQVMPYHYFNSMENGLVNTYESIFK